MHKRGNSTVYPMSHNIKQYNNISLLGITIQGNCKFGLHVKAKLLEANKCLFVIRSLHKEGYTQDETDHLFNSVVIPKLLYGLMLQVFPILLLYNGFYRDATRGVIRRPSTTYMNFWRKATDAFSVASNAIIIH